MSPTVLLLFPQYHTLESTDNSWQLTHCLFLTAAIATATWWRRRLLAVDRITTAPAKYAYYEKGDDGAAYATNAAETPIGLTFLSRSVFISLPRFLSHSCAFSFMRWFCWLLVSAGYTAIVVDDDDDNNRTTTTETFIDAVAAISISAIPHHCSSFCRCQRCWRFVDPSWGIARSHAARLSFMFQSSNRAS